MTEIMDLVASRVDAIPPQEVRRRVREQLRGTESSGLVFDHYDTHPITVLIWLLRTARLAPRHRSAIVLGLEDGCDDVSAFLTAPAIDSDPEPYLVEARNLFNVLDAACPSELALHARAFLNLVLGLPVKDARRQLLAWAVRAAKAQLLTPDHVAFWRKLLDERQAAALAFNALLVVNKDDRHLEGELATLWTRMLMWNWPVDAAYLTRTLSLARKDPFIIEKILPEIPDALYESLLIEIGRWPWSAEWAPMVQQHADRQTQPVYVQTSA